jgi:hypothetical protein
VKLTHAHGLFLGTAISIALFAFAAIPAVSSAQTSIQEVTAAALLLSANPQTPGPNQPVTLTLTSYTTTLSSATKGVGQTSFTATSGASGSTHAIRASIVAANGANAQATFTLHPATIALLYEAGTYTPPFYRGRSLASANAPVHVHANAQFGSTPESSINYTWSVNGRVMQNLSGVGRSDLVISGPTLYGALIVSVDASASGNTRATQSIRIPAVTPVIDLYSDDALLGIQYRNAISGSSDLHSDQSTLTAEPYFFAVSDPQSSDLLYSWSVNGTPVLADATSPSRITLQVKGGASGTASVGLSLASRTFSLENTKASWQVRVTPSGSGATPFTNIH